MKKTLFIIAACALAAVSCQKEMAVDNGNISEGILTVTADIAQFGADTKTSIDGAATTIKPHWSEDDEIKLFATDGTSAIYVLNATDKGKSSATFTLKDGQTALVGTFACAYYPASNATAYTDGTGITANIPSEQAYVAPVTTGVNQGSFANGSFPMIGTGTLNTEGMNLNLTFKNVFGLVQLNFTGTETIKQIELVSSQMLSGVATIATDGSCTLTKGGNFVDLTTTAETQPTLDGTAKAFYIAVPAESTVSKIYVTTTSTSTRPLFKAKDITVSRSKIASLASATLSGAGFVQVAEYQEATDKLPVVVAGSVWAPVNCGYTSTYTYGLLYQWGRKYGQAYETGTISPTDMDKADDTETNKDKFGKYDSSTKNWFSGTVDNTLWNGSSKGTSDPCPAGWRVPTSDELGNLLYSDWDPSQQKGTEKRNTDWENTGWDSTNLNGNLNGLTLPAAGMRRYSNGIVQNRGSHGYYWSSSIYGNKARCLYFSSAIAYVSNYDRANGYSVRCVQE